MVEAEVVGAEVSFRRGRSDFYGGPKCLLREGRSVFSRRAEGLKCLDEVPKCLFKKGPKGPK